MGQPTHGSARLKSDKQVCDMGELHCRHTPGVREILGACLAPRRGDTQEGALHHARTAFVIHPIRRVRSTGAKLALEIRVVEQRLKEHFGERPAVAHRCDAVGCVVAGAGGRGDIVPRQLCRWVIVGEAIWHSREHTTGDQYITPEWELMTKPKEIAVREQQTGTLAQMAIGGINVPHHKRFVCRRRWGDKLLDPAGEQGAGEPLDVSDAGPVVSVVLGQAGSRNDRGAARAQGRRAGAVVQESKRLLLPLGH